MQKEDLYSREYRQLLSMSRSMMPEEYKELIHKASQDLPANEAAVVHLIARKERWITRMKFAPADWALINEMANHFWRQSRQPAHQIKPILRRVASYILTYFVDKGGQNGPVS